MEEWLPAIWIGLLGVAVTLYVLMDGFDLGLGILFPLARDRVERDQMMSSVAPFWDGNETWLVLGGGGLWVAFPKAYAIIMPALYIPVIVMLLALILRGVSFEFRVVSENRAWDFTFFFGSLVATFAQGLILGGLIQGVVVRDGAFAGGPFDWFNAFTLCCALGLIAGYGLLGVTWIMLKTEGPVRDRMRALAVPLLAAVMVFVALVSLWTPLTVSRIAERWFAWPNIGMLWPLPILTAGLAFLVLRAIWADGRFLPFFGTMGIFLFCFLGLAVSTWPFIVPPPGDGPGGVTVMEAASSPETQLFLLVGALALIPVNLAYTAFNYWTFRGRVRPGDTYH
ncbi:cytochrome d ubiquinol oxidase subunit II [Afifella sp. IM 167]|uniref:cytochrome d ubiquinol oxidase subunit II n=1 Tax=Afifella sp. IM 167 TaxID=2033586 RepID=UPI001CCADE81|nr:cytochrome d ubiquinol oxidase subunit II [Afifella sp. IM 167]MBZ8133366.1 cytochrome d ubiquinol oxidase subunit II [Afifella sp. IM 167]